MPLRNLEKVNHEVACVASLLDHLGRQQFFDGAGDPRDLFGKNGILQEPTKALAERALSTELDAHLTEERFDPPLVRG